MGAKGKASILSANMISGVQKWCEKNLCAKKCLFYRGKNLAIH
jgi:hypothetical protein